MATAVGEDLSVDDWFTRVYREHELRLRRRFGQWHTPAHAIDDLVQDTFSSVYRRAHERGIDEGDTWKLIATIARRRWLEENARARKFAEGVAWLSAGSDVMRVGDDPAGVATARAHLAALFDQLTLDERRALVLHHWVGLSHEEIAARMGRPRRGISSLLSRARKKLNTWRDLLDDEKTVAPGGWVSWKLRCWRESVRGRSAVASSCNELVRVCAEIAAVGALGVVSLLGGGASLESATTPPPIAAREHAVRMTPSAELPRRGEGPAPGAAQAALGQPVVDRPSGPAPGAPMGLAMAPTADASWSPTDDPWTAAVAIEATPPSRGTIRLEHGVWVECDAETIARVRADEAFGIRAAAYCE